MSAASARAACSVKHASRRGRAVVGATLVVALLVMASLASSAQAAAVPLGTAANFAVLAGSTVTNAGPSLISGDVGVSPGSAVTGFGPGRVIPPSAIYRGGSIALKAKNDLTTAYNNVAGRSSTETIFADLGGRTLAPGVYTSASSLSLNGTLTLDAKGDPSAVFVFQAGSTLLVGTTTVSHIRLIDGAQAGNVFWQVGSSATIGVGSAFAGNILALTSITMKTYATLNGRALAENGAVTLDTTTIGTPAAATAPGGAPPPPTPPGGGGGGLPPPIVTWSIGQGYRGAGPGAEFDGSMDTRPAASAIGSALSGLGYDNHTELSGQSPQAVIGEAPTAAVIAIFDHANGGIMVTGGAGTRFCGEEGLTGSYTPYKYCGPRHSASLNPYRFLSLGQLKLITLSRVRLMIFGGCETATNGGRYYGNLMKTAKRLGVHSVIGFSGLIYYPYLGTPNASHRSGDFFWSRFAVYLRKGFTIDAAWHRALADMVTINKPYGGVTDGYQNLVIGGASPDPGNLQLTITGSDAAAVVDQNAEHNRQGDLVEFSANASSSGAIRLSAAGARAAATRFLAEHAPHIASLHLSVVSEHPASHAAGEKLESFTYRSHVAGVPGPAIALVEVDLRTAKVVFEAAGRATSSSTRFAVTAHEAESAALAAVAGRGVVLSATRDIWSYPRWTVTIRQPGGLLGQVQIDAANGRVASTSYADPSS